MLMKLTTDLGVNTFPCHDSAEKMLSLSHQGKKLVRVLTSFEEKDK